MRVRNYTPHDLNVYRAQDPTAGFDRYSSEGVVRALQVDREGLPVRIDTADGGSREIRTAHRRYSDVTGLPDFGESSVNDPDRLCEGDLVVVSLVALEALIPSLSSIDPYGITIVAPDTGPDSVVRDESGNILGVTAFIRPSAPKS